MDYPYQMDGFPNPFETIKRKNSFEIIDTINNNLKKHEISHNDTNLKSRKKFKSVILNNNKVKNSDNDNSSNKKIKIK